MHSHACCLPVQPPADKPPVPLASTSHSPFVHPPCRWSNLTPSWPGFYLPHRAPVPALPSWGAGEDTWPAGVGAEGCSHTELAPWGQQVSGPSTWSEAAPLPPERCTVQGLASRGSPAAAALAETVGGRGIRQDLNPGPCWAHLTT